MLTPEISHYDDLKSFTKDPKHPATPLKKLLDDDTSECLKALKEPDRRIAAEFASYYLKCVEGMKGEHALILQNQLRENLKKPEKERMEFSVPESIMGAITWVCPTDMGGGDATK